VVSEGGCSEVTFIYSLNFTSDLSSYPPPALPRKCSHPLWQMQKREGVTEGSSGGGRGKLLNKLETWKDLFVDQTFVEPKLENNKNI